MDRTYELVGDGAASKKLEIFWPGGRQAGIVSSVASIKSVHRDGPQKKTPGFRQVTGVKYVPVGVVSLVLAGGHNTDRQQTVGSRG